MPLFEKSRIEVYLPDLPRQPEFRELRDRLAAEVTFAFGGCSVAPDVDGHYLAESGEDVRDRINVLYTDVPLVLRDDFASIERYADELRTAVQQALDEDAVLVAVYPVYHSM